MSNTLIILWREATMRLRRPAFWVATVLVPALLAMLYALPLLSASQQEQAATVVVVDETGLFANGMHNTPEVRFRRAGTIDEGRALAADSALLLYIPLRQATMPHDAFLYHTRHTPSLRTQSAIDHQLQLLLRNAILEDVYGISTRDYNTLLGTHITLHTRDAATNHESHLQMRTTVGLVLAAIMVLALLIFGSQVIRSVQEERQNRIAEVMATSARPWQILVGKIAGVATTATLQMLLWIGLTAAAVVVIQGSMPDLFTNADTTAMQLQAASRGGTAAIPQPTATLTQQVAQGLEAIQLPLLALVYVVMFLLSYFLYGSLLALVASVIDSQADALQWSVLIGAPLLLTIALAAPLLHDPSGTLATWLTLVPFTSAPATMLRLPFGISTWQLLLSAALTLLCTIAAALSAAHIYRRHITD